MLFDLGLGGLGSEWDLGSCLLIEDGVLIELHDLLDA